MPIEMYDLAGGDGSIRFSPYCWRIRMALAHKGLDVKTIPVRFMEKEKLAFSGQKLVPVIRDGEKVVSDSWTIAKYLEETYASRPSLFPGADAMALTNFIRNWTQARLTMPILRAVLMDLVDTIDPGDRDYFRTSREARFGKKLEEVAAPEAEARAALKAELGPMRDTLKDQPFLNGAAPAYADYCVFGTFMWARGVSAKQLLDADDPVYAWRERMLDAHGAVARNAAGRGK